ncbi:MAG: DUF3102 domain-containing protein [Alphaproteobacteria bacterium]|nr:MAG: DUF3102 domain-containing protein [Alphaproteobacteria bacterium]
MQRRTTDLKIIKHQLEEAKSLHAQAQEAEASAESNTLVALEKAWQCGKRLNLIKESIGHGNWLTWLGSNWPQLTDRTAQVYMKIDRDNPNALHVADLKLDSIRKHRIAKVPKKPRPDEPGDQSFAKPEHHSAVINELARLFQRIDAGQQTVDEEELRRDFRPAYERLQRLYGDA